MEENHTTPIWNTLSNVEQNKSPWLVKLTLQRTYHPRGRGKQSNKKNQNRLKEALSSLGIFWKIKTRNPRKSGLLGRTAKIQALYYRSKRPVFFELYIPAFYMQQKITLLAIANLLLCHHILKSYCQRQKALFSYLLFKSCYSVFVLLVQRVHLMLQSFLLVQNNNSML